MTVNASVIESLRSKSDSTVTAINSLHCSLLSDVQKHVEDSQTEPLLNALAEALSFVKDAKDQEKVFDILFAVVKEKKYSEKGLRYWLQIFRQIVQKEKNPELLCCIVRALRLFLKHYANELQQFVSSWAKIVFILLVNPSDSVQKEVLLFLKEDRAKLLEDKKFSPHVFNIIKTNFVEDLLKLCEDDKAVLALHLWKVIIEWLGQAFHRGNTFVNAMLRVVEKAFKSSNPLLILEAFQAWKALMINFSLNSDIISSPKYLKLLLHPLKKTCMSDENVMQMKCRVWWFLVLQVNNTLSQNFDQVCVPLLQYCLGLSSESSTRQSLTSGTMCVKNEKLHKEGVEILIRLLELTEEQSASIKLNRQLSVVCLSSSVPNSVFVKYIETYTSSTEAVFNILSNDNDKETAYYIFHLLMRRTALAEEENRAESITAVNSVLNLISNILTRSSSCPENYMQFLEEASKLSPRILTSHVYSSGKSGILHGTPALTLLTFLLQGVVFDYPDADKRVQVLFTHFLYLGVKGEGVSSLHFVSTVLGLLGKLHTSHNIELLMALWQSTATALLQCIQRSQEVNQGNTLDYDFSCLVSCLSFPVQYFLNVKRLQWNYKTVLKKWGDLYKEFSRCAALVSMAPPNAACEEFCQKILPLVKETSTKENIYYVEAVSSIIEDIMELLDKSAIGRPSQVSSPTKWGRTRGQTLGTLTSFIDVLAASMEGFHESYELISSTSVTVPPKVKHSVASTALRLIKINQELFMSLKLSPLVEEVLIKLAALIAPFLRITGSSKQMGAKLFPVNFSVKVEGLWNAMVTCIQTYFVGSRDSSFLSIVAPLFQHTFLHPRRLIHDKAVQLWQALFSGSASSLVVPLQLKNILRKVKPPLIPNIDLSSAEEFTTSSQTLSQSGDDSLVPDAVLYSKANRPEVQVLSFSPKLLSPKKQVVSPAPGIKNTAQNRLETMRDEEFVKISSPVKKPRVLTEHQKEVLREKRHLLPALYNDMSQSTQDIQVFESQESENSQEDKEKETGRKPDEIIQVDLTQESDEKDISKPVEPLKEVNYNTKMVPLEDTDKDKSVQQITVIDDSPEPLVSENSMGELPLKSKPVNASILSPKQCPDENIPQSPVKTSLVSGDVSHSPTRQLRVYKPKRKLSFVKQGNVSHNSSPIAEDEDIVPSSQDSNESHKCGTKDSVITTNCSNSAISTSSGNVASKREPENEMSVDIELEDHCTGKGKVSTSLCPPMSDIVSVENQNTKNEESLSQIQSQSSVSSQNGNSSKSSQQKLRPKRKEIWNYSKRKRRSSKGMKGSTKQSPLTFKVKNADSQEVLSTYDCETLVDEPVFNINSQDITGSLEYTKVILNKDSNIVQDQHSGGVSAENVRDTPNRKTDACIASEVDKSSNSDLPDSSENENVHNNSVTAVSEVHSDDETQNIDFSKYKEESISKKPSYDRKSEALNKSCDMERLSQKSTSPSPLKQTLLTDTFKKQSDLEHSNSKQSPTTGQNESSGNVTSDSPEQSEKPEQNVLPSTPTRHSSRRRKKSRLIIDSEESEKLQKSPKIKRTSLSKNTSSKFPNILLTSDPVHEGVPNTPEVCETEQQSIESCQPVENDLFIKDDKRQEGLLEDKHKECLIIEETPAVDNTLNEFKGFISQEKMEKENEEIPMGVPEAEQESETIATLPESPEPLGSPTCLEDVESNSSETKQNSDMGCVKDNSEDVTIEVSESNDNQEIEESKEKLALPVEINKEPEIKVDNYDSKNNLILSKENFTGSRKRKLPQQISSPIAGRLRAKLAARAAKIAAKANSPLVGKGLTNSPAKSSANIDEILQQDGELSPGSSSPRKAPQLNVFRDPEENKISLENNIMLSSTNLSGIIRILKSPTTKNKFEKSITVASLSRSQKIIDAAMKNLGRSSPKGFSPSSEFRSPQLLKAKENEEGTASVSPTSGILKKRKASDEMESPPLAKQRRVSFADPIVQGEYTFESNSRRRPVSRCLDMSSATSGRNKIKASHKQKAFHEITENQALNEEEPDEKPEDSQELMCEDLAQCPDPIEEVAPELTTSVWIPGLQRLLKSRGILTVGDLSVLTGPEVDSIPIKVPKIKTLRKALRQHLVTCKHLDHLSKEDDNVLVSDVQEMVSVSGNEESLLCKEKLNAPSSAEGNVHCERFVDDGSHHASETLVQTDVNINSIMEQDSARIFTNGMEQFVDYNEAVSLQANGIKDPDKAIAVNKCIDSASSEPLAFYKGNASVDGPVAKTEHSMDTCVSLNVIKMFTKNENNIMGGVPACSNIEVDKAKRLFKDSLQHFSEDNFVELAGTLAEAAKTKGVIINMVKTMLDVMKNDV